MRLIELQRRLQAAIVNDTDSELALGAKSHPWIHRRHFWSRMRDFAVVRHPLLARWLGAEELDRIIRAFIAAHPPRALIGSDVVAPLAEFLATAEPWCAFPIISQLAAFDFRRSALAFAVEQATLNATDLPVPANAMLQLKKRAAVIVTRFKFHLRWPAAHATPLDDEPTYLLVHMTNRRHMTLELDHQTFLAMQRLAEGITLRDLVDHTSGAEIVEADIEQLVARCVAEDLLVAVEAGCAAR
jgi:hypothetical protein